jgi:protein-L-isoaspartate(D-aspartate) O-methyltransferase
MAQMIGLSVKVIAIEHVKELIHKSMHLLENSFPHLRNSVRFVLNDGRNGYSSEGPYDIIFIGGSVTEVPQTILDQLKKGGRLMASISSDNDSQKLVTIDKMSNGFIKKKTRIDVDFEPLTDLETQLNSCLRQY